MSEFHSWENLLFPDGQEIRLSVREIGYELASLPAETSTFAPPLLDLSRLPSHIQLLQDLPSKMHQDLRRIVSENYAKQAAGSEIISCRVPMTPDLAFYLLRTHCESIKLHFVSNLPVDTIAVDIFSLVLDIYLALTGHSLKFDMEISTKRGVVITDFVYLLGDTIKI